MTAVHQSINSNISEFVIGEL